MAHPSSAGANPALTRLDLPLPETPSTITMGGGGQYLPGGIADVAQIALPMDDGRKMRDIAGAAGPAEAAGETAVEDGQHVAAGQGLQPCMQFGHRQEAVTIRGVGVPEDQVALRTIIAIQRDAVLYEMSFTGLVWRSP